MSYLYFGRSISHQHLPASRSLQIGGTDYQKRGTLYICTSIRWRQDQGGIEGREKVVTVEFSESRSSTLKHLPVRVFHHRPSPSVNTFGFEAPR